MSKTTRVAAIERHLVNGGFTYLGLTLAEQEQGPNVSEDEGFALRQHTDEAGTLVVVAARTARTGCGPWPRSSAAWSSGT
ncbi:hypothetical protein LUR56_31125 [Streptomyces sp. MT29]|nr:hypothetical protein [Streptomyces sp. MT29]